MFGMHRLLLEAWIIKQSKEIEPIEVCWKRMVVLGVTKKKMKVLVKKVKKRI